MFKKSGVPSPVTYQAKKSAKAKLKTHKSRRTNRIPSSDGRESFRAATRVRPRCDIVHTHDGEAVKPGIGKSEGLLTPVKQVVV